MKHFLEAVVEGDKLNAAMAVQYRANIWWKEAGAGFKHSTTHLQLLLLSLLLY